MTSASLPTIDHPAPASPELNSKVLKVLEGYLAELEGGAPANPEELLARHPELAGPLREYLASLEFLHRAALSLHGSDQTRQVASEPTIAEMGTLGDFRILREIGRGGMGIVYEAEQISLGRRVALKVLPFAAALDSKQLQRFKNEAHAAAGLQHTNIVPVYFVGCERGVHFYAMQFVEGQTLAALITELRRLESSEAGAEGNHTATRSWAVELISGQGCHAFAAPEQPAELPASSGAAKACHPLIRDPKPAAETLPVKHRSSTLDSRSSPFFHTVANLGIQAAEALEHAHQLGVIHRDIKPANLMVENIPLSADHSALSTQHSALRLWITDFGLAHCQGGCELTMSGDLLGTLRYMSPEQALAKRVIVDERTDIYSLGVTLYELLTLEPAFPGSDRQEILRQIAFEDPKPPRRWNKAIPQELETIVLKAMEKSPADRYATAQELADDLGRYLEDKPIRARRPTFVQRARKWTRRHRSLVLVGSVAVLLVLVASILSTLLIGQAYLSESGARKDAVEALGKAQKSAAKAEAVKDFLLDEILGRASEDQGRGNKLTLDDVIEKAAAKIDGAFPDEPEVEADVRYMIGNAYLSMSMPSKAELHFQRAWELRRDVLGEDDDDTLDALRCLARSHSHQGHFRKAEELFKKALQGMRRVLSNDDEKVLELLDNLAWNLDFQGRWSEAADMYRECLEARRRVLKPEDSAIMNAMSDLSQTLSNQGEWEEAEKLARESLRLSQLNFTDADARTVKAAAKFTFVLCREAKGREAEEVARKTQEAAVRIWGRDTPEPLTMDALLIAALWCQDTPDKLSDAERICRHNLEILLRTPEVNKHRIDECKYLFGFVLRSQGNWSEAERVFGPALQSVRQSFAEEHPFRFWGESVFGAILEASGQKEEAGKLLHGAIVGMRKAVPPEHPFLALALYDWAEHLLEEGALQQAEEALREVSHFPPQNFPPGNMRPRGESLAALGWVLTKQGRAKEGEPFLKDGLEICRKYLPQGHWATVEAESRLGGCLAALGQYADAEKLLVTSYQTLETARGAPPPRTRQALERVIQLYASSGQADKAAQWRAKRQAEGKVEKKAEGKK